MENLIGIVVSEILMYKQIKTLILFKQDIIYFQKVILMIIRHNVLDIATLKNVHIKHNDFKEILQC